MSRKSIIWLLLIAVLVLTSCSGQGPPSQGRLAVGKSAAPSPVPVNAALASVLTPEYFNNDPSHVATFDKTVVVYLKGAADGTGSTATIPYAVPSAGTFTFNLAGSAGLPYNVAIVDSSGKQVLKVASAQATATTSLAAGPYTVTLSTTQATAGLTYPVFVRGADTLSVAAQPSGVPSAPLNQQILVSANDCSGCNLSSSDLGGATLNNTTLTNAYLANTKLNGAALQGTDLKSANLTSASLNSADLTGAILTNANLTSAYLIDANLTNADFTGTNLKNAILSRARLAGINLTGVTLANLNFTNIYLANANLTNANLTNANLTNATLTGATLTGAILNSATWVDGHTCSTSSTYSGTTCT